MDGVDTITGQPMPTLLSAFRQSRPETRSWSPEALTEYIYKNDPDFKSKFTIDEFREISGANEEIRIQNQAEMGDFHRGVMSGGNALQGSWDGAIGIGGSLMNKAGIPGGQAIRDWGIEGYKKNTQEASLYPTKTLKDIGAAEGVVGKAGTFVDWAQGGIGQLLPSMVEAATGAVIGSLVAPGPGTAGGAFATRTLLKKGIDEVTDKMVADYIKKGLIKEGAEVEVRNLLKKQATNAALKKLGGRAGMGAAVLPMESGGNYGEVFTEHGIDAPETALFFGALATSLEYMGGNSKLVDQFVDAVAGGSGRLVKRTAKELLQNIPEEAAQEAGQETLSILNTVVNTDEKLLTWDNLERIVEAAGLGALGGGAGVVPQAIGTIRQSGITPGRHKAKDLLNPTKQPAAEPVKPSKEPADLLNNLDVGGADLSGISQPPLSSDTQSPAASPLNQEPAPSPEPVTGADTVDRQQIAGLPDNNLLAIHAQAVQQLEKMPQNEGQTALVIALEDEMDARGLQSPTAQMGQPDGQIPLTEGLSPAPPGEVFTQPESQGQISPGTPEAQNYIDQMVPPEENVLEEELNDALAEIPPGDDPFAAPAINQEPISLGSPDQEYKGKKQLGRRLQQLSEAKTTEDKLIAVSFIKQNLRNTDDVPADVRQGVEKKIAEIENKAKGEGYEVVDKIGTEYNENDRVGAVFEKGEGATGDDDLDFWEYKGVAPGKQPTINKNGILHSAGTYTVRTRRATTDELKTRLRLFKRRGYTEGANKIEAELAKREASPGQDRRKAGAPVELDRRGEVDRRINLATRKRVADMTEEEKAVALYTSTKSGLKNERAYDESKPKAHQAFIDIDGLKFANDKISHDAGDQLIRLMGEALVEYDESYHKHGDEFLMQADDPVLLDKAIQKAYDFLERERFSYTTPEGVKHTFKLGFSYGQAQIRDGETREQALDRAEKRMYDQKGERAAAGLRGEQPQEYSREAPGRDVPEGAALEEADGEIPPVDAAAADTNTEPTDGQIEAGNYKKGHATLDGLNLSIENPEGSTRKGTDTSGHSWETTMAHHYGYILGTQGKDKDHVDVFINPGTTTSPKVFIVDQVNPDGAFDEHKVMLGFKTLLAAKKAYNSNYSKGWNGLGNITETTMDDFKAWSMDGKRKTQPYRPIEKKEAPSTATADTQPDDILTKENRPFKTKGAATLVIKNRKLIDTHEAVEIGDGQWVIREKNAKPEAKSEPAQEVAPEDALLTQALKIMQKEANTTASKGVASDRQGNKFNFGASSPQWFTDLNAAAKADKQRLFSRKEINTLIDKHVAGQNFTEKQIERWAYLKEAAEILAEDHPDLVAMQDEAYFEGRGFEPMGGQKVVVADLKEGDKFIGRVDGVDDEYTVINIDSETGDATLQDGITKTVDMFDQVQVEAIRRVEETTPDTSKPVAAEKDTEIKSQAAPVALSDIKTPADLNKLVSQAEGTLAKTQIVDWGNRAGQGQRIGKMVVGAMSGAPSGKVKYTDILGALEETEPQNYKDATTIFSDSNLNLTRYARLRLLGYGHNESIDTILRVTEAPKSNGGIQDFGEKIGGARKDIQPSIEKEFTDDELASQPLSKIWPKKEVDDIEETWLAALAHAARESIPSKPRKEYKVKRWIEDVKRAREIAGMAKSFGRDAIISRLEENPRLRALAGKIKLLEQIDRKYWSKIKEVYELPNAYSYDDDGEKIRKPHVSIKTDSGYKTFDGAESVNDIVNDVVSYLDGKKSQPKNMQFEVRGNPRAGYFINKKGDPEYRRLKEFKTAEEAILYRKDNYDSLVDTWEESKEKLNVKEKDTRGKENRPRRGADYRKGKDVTPEMFSDAFGFRGVEFGNWVSQGKGKKDRQGMLNNAYDAMMDLASILKIPTKAISLNGTLGLGFGSRGSGWASAHYEPGNLVINLTKTRGAGALAHEWFHALDNYFQMKRGPGRNREEIYITYQPETQYRDKTSGQMMSLRRFNIAKESYRGFNPENWEKVEGVRPEVEAAFSDLVEALNASPMAKRARAIDKGKSNGYWSRIIERAARSFENYIIAKMMDGGYHNDYLANVVSQNDFVRDLSRYPYLLEEEIPPITEAFDQLFNTIQTKETDKGVAMFQRTSTKPWPENFPNAIVNTTLAHINKELGKVHAAAKAGDSNAADDLVEKTIKPEKVRALAKDHPGAVVVPVMALEESGHNQIPQSIVIAMRAIGGFDVATNVYQTNKTQHTGKSAIDRLMRRAEFSGGITPGKEYILVDDHITQGGTLSELRHYIENNGGRVVAVFSLTASRGSTIIAIKPDTISLIKKRFGENETNELLQEYNISGNIEALTAGEGQQILRYGSLNSIRNAIAERGVGEAFQRISPPLRSSKVVPAPSGLKKSDIDAVLSKLASGLVTPPSIEVVQSESDLPQPITDEIARQKAEGNINAVYYQGKTYYVADNIKSKEAAQSAFLHEVFGHHGIEALLTKQQAFKFFNQVHLSRLNTPEYRKVAADYGFNLRTKEGRLGASREYVARLAESGVDDGLMTRLIGMVRDAMRKLGINLKINDNDIRRLIAAGARQMQGKTSYLVPDTMAAQKQAQKWYSSMEQHLADKLPNKGTGKSYANVIQSWAKKGMIKQEELEWSGLTDWLNEQEKVTKTEVLDWLAENNVRVEEVVKGEGNTANITVMGGYYAVVDNNTGEVLKRGLQTSQSAEKWIEENVSEEPLTKFSEYQLPGGENYKELLITLPNRVGLPEGYSIEQLDDGSWRALSPGGSASFGETKELALQRAGWQSGESQKNTYTSSHWSEPNVLSHIRFNERTGPNGERVLFIEEVQSDWHQEGRKKGYGLGADSTRVEKNRNGSFDVYAMRNGEEVLMYKNFGYDQALRFADTLEGGRIPNAPFKKTWPQLAMKRAVRYAAENGFDAVAWTPGEVQAERYDLSKQVNYIEYSPATITPSGEKDTSGNTFVNIAAKEGNIAIDVNSDGVVVGGRNKSAENFGVVGKPLDEVVGKEIAKKIMSGGKGRLETEDLKVGGEGMIGFYDKILPATANKFFGKKQWGNAKVGEIELVENVGGADFDIKRTLNGDGFYVAHSDGRYFTGDPSQIWSAEQGDAIVYDTQSGAARALKKFGNTIKSKSSITAHSLPITPEMRDKALTEGMPLFQAVYHGTPHIWQPEPGFPHGRPRLDKIGTGEDAQAYGWGWYSADSEGVGSTYRETLSGRHSKYDDKAKVAGALYDAKLETSVFDDAVTAGALSTKYSERDFINAVVNGDLDYSDFSPATWAKAEKNLFTEGSLYKLDLPDSVIPKLLDWDKPLSEQSEYVKEALDKILPSAEEARAIVKESERLADLAMSESVTDGRKTPNTDAYNQHKSKIKTMLAKWRYSQDNPSASAFTSIGHGLYNAIDFALGSPKAASEYLASIGIPGNKYLDGMSRNKGEGDYNYVLWDQPTLDKVALLDRNGEKLDDNRGTFDTGNPDIMFKINDDAAESTPSILNALKKRKGDFELPKPDITLMDRILNLMSHYSQKVPALRKIYEAGLSWVDDKNHYSNQIFKTEGKDGEEVSYINVIESLKKSNKDGYDGLKTYLLDRDKNAIGYTVEQEENFYILKDPKGADVGTYQSEATAWLDAVKMEAKDAIGAGMSRDVANGLVAFRMMAHNIFHMRHAAIVDLIEKYEAEGRKPEIAYRDDNGEEMKIDLKVALAEMGDLRGYYFPRVRNQGQWVIRATKKGEQPILEMRDLKLTANKRRSELERDGYTVAPITRSEKTPESVFALAGQNIAINELVDKALEGVNSPKAKTLKDLNINGKWDGNDFIITGTVNRGKEKEIMKAYGGEFETEYWEGHRKRGLRAHWRFKDADKNIEDKLKTSLFWARGLESADTELLFAHEFAQQLGNTIKERGARSAMIQRRKLLGKDVWAGYEEDPLSAMTRAGQSTASAQAKKEMAVKMIQAMQGTTESWSDWKARMEEEGYATTDGEKHFGPAHINYENYIDFVKEEKISASKQKNAFEAGTKYMQDMLRNDEAIDRVMGTIRGIAVLKYLGFRVAAPAVNLTALMTNVPAAMRGYAKIPLSRSGALLAGAMKDYAAYSKNPETLDKDVKQALDHIHDNGWHAEQLNMEAINVLKGKMGQGWGRFTDMSMAMFGATEKLNRISTILGAYKGIKEKNPDMSFDAAITLAKEVSDKAHGTYGKANYPELARGTNLGSQILKSAYVFKTFSHNYLATLKELGVDKKDYAAATWMMATPALLSGLTASVAVPGAMAITNALLSLVGADADDPEEAVYNWVYDNMGKTAGRFVEQGAFGLLGFNLKGSLQISVTDIPTNLTELLGAPGSMIQDAAYGIQDMMHGEWDKGLESILPNAFAAPLKAYREHGEGITTHTNTPVFWGRERLKSSAFDAWLRALSFNPSELSSKRSQLWRERNVESKYRDRRAAINSRIKDFWLKPPAKRKTSEWADILVEIYEYNARLKRTGRLGLINPISASDIRSFIKRSMKATKKDLKREALRRAG